MTRSSGLVATLFILSFFVTLSAASAGADDGNNLKDFLPAKAREAGLPLVVDFGQNRCGQCIKQSAAIEVMKEETVGEVEWLFVHVRKEEKLTEANKVFLLPTLIFFDAGGNELFRNVGLMEAPALRAKIKELGL